MDFKIKIKSVKSIQIQLSECPKERVLESYKYQQNNSNSYCIKKKKKSIQLIYQQH